MFWTLCFHVSSFPRSLGGEKSIHVGGMGKAVHLSFPSTSFEIFTFASKGEACPFTLVGKRLFWGVGGGLVSLSALLERWPLRGGVLLPKSIQAHGCEL